MTRGTRIRLQVMAMAFVVMAAVAGFGGATAGAADVIPQIKLEAKQIEGFIAAQKDMAKIAEKMQGATSDKPDPKIQAELDGIAKAHGFNDFAQYDDVAANISMVMAGIDPQSGAFTDPTESIKKEIEDVKASTSLSEKDKKQMLDELGEALKVTQPIQYPENIELVKQYREKIDAVLQ